MIRKLSKLLMLLIFIYYNWYQETFGTNTTLLYMLAGLVTGLQLLEICSRRQVSITMHNEFLKGNVIFVLYAGITGMFVAYSVDAMYSSLLQLIVFIVFCLDSVNIANNENSMDWLLRILEFTAVICCAQTIFAGALYMNAGSMVRTMSTSNNPNVLGYIALSGIFSVVIREEKIKKFFFTSIAELMLFTYVIVLTGSRKSFISAALIIIVWITVWVFHRSNSPDSKRIDIVDFFRKLTVIIGIIALIYYMLPTFTNTNMFERFTNLFAVNGLESTGRMSLYRIGFDLLKDHPFFGVGYRQFGFYTSEASHTHSTYMELLSCTGIIGTIIYLFPIVSLCISLINKLIRKVNTDRYKMVIIFSILLIHLFLGVGVIYFYMLQMMVFITYIFWEYNNIVVQN